MHRFRVPTTLQSRSDDGVAALEFALVAPILILLVFGIIGYGAFLGVAQSVQDVAGQGARAAVGGVDTTDRIGLATDAVQRAVAANPLLSSANLAVAAGPDPADADRFVVTLTYDLSKTVVAAVPPFVPLPKSVVRTASVRRGGL